MTAEPLDELLARLRSATTTIGARLVDIENDTTRHMLEHSTLRGASASRWDATRRTILDLWRSYGELTSLVARADHLRGPGRAMPRDREAELHRLLTDPTIQIETGGSRITPADLVDRMTGALGSVDDVIARAAEAWDTLVPRLADARSAVDDLEVSARSLGSDDAPDIPELRARLTELAEALAADPLSVETGQIDAFDARVAAVQRELAAAADLRDTVDQRMAEARLLIGQLARTVDEARAAHHDASLKIAGARVPSPPADRGDLVGRLDSIVAICGRGRWHEGCRLLVEWQAVADAQLEVARTLLTRIRTPIENRNELRSRLDAYRVKAARTGVIEERAVAEAYEQARDVLYHAPTDLAMATELVHRYQHLLETDHGSVAS